MALFPEVEGIITFAWYPYGWERVSNAYSTPFDSGHKSVRAGQTEQTRRAQLRCRNLPKLSKERISAFFREIRGGGNIFQIINRVDAIVPPYFAPALSNVGGGAFGSRTYYVVTTRGVLFAISPPHGIMWTFETGSRVRSAPIVRNGRIYLVSESGDVFCFLE